MHPPMMGSVLMTACMMIALGGAPAVSWRVLGWGTGSKDGVEPRETQAQVRHAEREVPASLLQTDGEVMAQAFQDWFGKTEQPDLSEGEKQIVSYGVALFRELEQGGSDRSRDCFKKAAMALRANCSSAKLKDDTRIWYAVELTRCEVSTAGKVLPPACEPVTRGTRVRATECVSELSTVGQLWTTYSGYFRDVTLMCYSVRFDLEKDDLKSLYRNVTAALLATHSVEKRRLKHASAANEVIGKVTEGLQDILSTVKTLVTEKLSRLGDLIETKEVRLGDSLNAQRELAEAAYRSMGAVVEKVQNDLGSIHKGETALAFSQQAAQSHAILAELSSAFDGLRHAAESSQAVVADMSEALNASLARFQDMATFAQKAVEKRWVACF
ncbi:hypothetical protein HDU96_005983 [Phlyctochytrium bullatum]|nr:hypothetical protein HDU96_005983 [Phlyctochytrium bullatum]